MSTIVVEQKHGYIAIGADTLTKYGYTNESADYIENHSKIIKVGENYIAIAGHASWNLILSLYFSKLESIPSMNSCENIFEMALELHEALREKYFLASMDDEGNEFESSELECLIS